MALTSKFYPVKLSNSLEPLASAMSHPSHKRTKASLLFLIILILEMWFNKSIGSCYFRDRVLGPDGEENEFTRFNTKKKWPEQALEEGGIDFDSLTYSMRLRWLWCRQARLERRGVEKGGIPRGGTATGKDIGKV